MARVRCTQPAAARLPSQTAQRDSQTTWTAGAELVAAKRTRQGQETVSLARAARRGQHSKPPQNQNLLRVPRAPRGSACCLWERERLKAAGSQLLQQLVRAQPFL